MTNTDDRTIAAVVVIAITCIVHGPAWIEMWNRASASTPLVSSTPHALFLDGRRLTDLDDGKLLDQDIRGSLVPVLYDALLDLTDSQRVRGGHCRTGRIDYALHPEAEFPLVRRLLFTAGQAQFGEARTAITSRPVLELPQIDGVWPPDSMQENRMLHPLESEAQPELRD